MKNNLKDRHLDIPSEANRDKHINFAAIENNEEDPADLPSTGPLANKNTDEKSFNLVIDNVPYMIKASPFSFNEETRFYISINDGPDHVFIWDREMLRLRPIDNNAGILPAALEEAISERLRRNHAG